MSIEMIGDKGDWRKINQDSALIDKLNREADREHKTTPSSNPTPKVQPSAPINSSQGYWSIPVNYRNGIYTVDLAKSLLDSGNAKTQEDWAKYSLNAKSRGDFYTGDMPLYHAVFSALFKQKNKPESEEARKFIQKQMRAKWLMTLTRIRYNPRGKDKVIHNFGVAQHYELEENIVGPDRFVEQGDNSALTALLGTGNINEIKEVYNLINQTPTYIWRVNSKPKQVDERVARFVASSGRAGLYCNWGPAYSNSSLGVRIASEASRSAK